MSNEEPSPDDVRTAIEQIKTLFDEVWEVRRGRLEFTPDEGIYQNAALVTPDGEYPAGEVYFWSTTFKGEHLVDIRERNVPPGVDLEQCRLEIRNSDGVVILAGDVLNGDDPPQTVGESLCLKIGMEADDE